jgi:hypothetical protein
MAIMLTRIMDLPRTLFWLAFRLFVMAAWPLLPRRWIDMDAPWWRKYDGWGQS